MRTSPILSLATAITLVFLSSSCGSMSDPANETELEAEAEADVNGMQAQLKGDFRSEMEGRKLTGELQDANLASGMPVSFCLVASTGVTPLAAPQTNAEQVALFELNSENGQMVPPVATATSSKLGRERQTLEPPIAAHHS